MENTENSIIKDVNIQLWDKELITEKYYNIFFKTILERTKAQLQAMYYNCYDCYLFADIMIEYNKIIDLPDWVDKNQLRRVLGRLVYSWQYIGLAESYTQFLKGIFGDEVIIKFKTVAPCVLDIEVSNFSLFISNLVGENMSDDIKGEFNFPVENIIGAEVIKNVSLNSINDFLQLLTPTGGWCQFRFLEG